MGNVNQGGNTTMLGHWRVVLKQAEQAAKAGQLDEALDLASRDGVADHRQAVQLRGKWARELIDRAGRRASANDLDGAIEDLNTAERHGVAPDLLATARLKLIDHVIEDLQSDLRAGEPTRVVTRIEQLRAQKIQGPTLGRLIEAAEAWKSARIEAARGEFGRAAELLDTVARLTENLAKDALNADRADLGRKQKEATVRANRFYQVLSESPEASPELLSAAEELLQIVPEHPAARQAKSRTWQKFGGVALEPSATQASSPKGAGSPEILYIDDSGMAPVPGSPGTTRKVSRHESPRSRPQSGPNGRFLLWADTIGGYLVCLDDLITLGRSGGDGHADVPILGDLARDHASISREGEHYTLRAIAPTFVNGRRINSSPIRDGDVIRLGSNVELEFRRPSPVTSTATLRLLSRHRLPMAVDGIILMAQSCLMGASRQCHMVAPRIKEPVVLFRQADTLWCRCPGAFEVDGRQALSRSPLTTRSSVQGEGFSFCLEPVTSRSTSNDFEIRFI